MPLFQHSLRGAAAGGDVKRTATHGASKIALVKPAYIASNPLPVYRVRSQDTGPRT